MANASVNHSPHWYGVPLRVALLTFIGTLLTFSVILFLSIIGELVISAIRGVPLQMRLAYRTIALPTALVAAAAIFVLALIMEVRRYRQAKSLAAIERMN